MNNSYAVYNGKFSSLQDIKISPLSRAYTFSDSVYEVIPFCKSKIIAFDSHISRLKKSCKAIHISTDIQKVSKEVLELINNCGHDSGYVYFQISRGIDPIRSHMFEDNIEAETFGYVNEFLFRPQNLKVMICDDLRWQRCDIKSTSLLGNIISMNSAKSEGCDEVIMHKNNILTEGGASNIFFSDDKCIYTPELSKNILPGITRDILLQELSKLGIRFKEGVYKINDLKCAKSAWLTSSTKGVAEITEIINLDTNLTKDHFLFKKCSEIMNDIYFS